MKESSSAPVDAKNKEIGRAVEERAGLCFLNTHREDLWTEALLGQHCTALTLPLEC